MRPHTTADVHKHQKEPLMITIQKHFPLSKPYPIESLGSPEDLLFFDIETTGFSGKYSGLYLIGCLYQKDSTWNLIQWFADTAASEKDLLHAFFTFLRSFSTLIHFNGDTFDIPYLLKRCAHYHLPYDFTAIDSLDIYRRIKPYGKLLGLKSLKQKAIEHFLNISRTDAYSGGELIQVYKDYLTSHHSSLLELLLLHNEDDLKGMPSLLPILSYPDFFDSAFALTTQNLCQKHIPGQKSIAVLELTCEGRCLVPVPVQAHVPPICCSVEENRLCLSIELLEGTLKHFYPNYKDYYYLIYEDTAIHKSIGEYVDKTARTKATSKTCYTKKSGLFLPQFAPIWEPVMKKEPKDKLLYAALSDVSFQSSEQLHRYLSQIFNHLEIKKAVSPQQAS